MNYKQLRNETQNMPTLREVVEEERSWVAAHLPYDRGTSLPLFQYVIEEGSGGAIVPLSKDLSIPAVSLLPHAHDQLLQRVDYGKRLYSRLPAKLNLLAINWLIQHESERSVLLRLQDDNKCRALLSSKYEPFDTLELLRAIEPLCANAKVRVAYDNEEVFHMSLTFPNTTTEVKVGDIMEQGIHISNSEVGMRSVTVAGYVYRLRCLNGMVGSGGDGGFFRFRHTGDSDRMRDGIKAAVESAYLEATKITAQFRNALTIAIDDPASRLQSITEDHDLSKEDFKDLLDHYLEEPIPTLFGVTNAITATARDRDGEEAYQLQQVAAKVLSGGGHR